MWRVVRVVRALHCSQCCPLLAWWRYELTGILISLWATRHQSVQHVYKVKQGEDRAVEHRWKAEMLLTSHILHLCGGWLVSQSNCVPQATHIGRSSRMLVIFLLDKTCEWTKAEVYGNRRFRGSWEAEGAEPERWKSGAKNVTTKIACHGSRPQGFTPQVSYCRNVVQCSM